MLTGTPNHPFWVDAVRDYVPLGKLEVGTVLHCRFGCPGSTSETTLGQRLDFHEEVEMASGRKVCAEEAVELLEQWERSGEPMSKWCAARGLNWYSLSAYKGWLFTRWEEERDPSVRHGGGPAANR